MKTLVIGASGHLGAHLCRVLSQQGLDVRALVRRSSCLDGLRDLKIEVVNGDILNVDSVEAAVRNCRYVFHLGSPTILEPGLKDTIVRGTQNVLAACAKANVERVVYTSSIATIGYSADKRRVLNETFNQFVNASDYHLGKWQAERSALEFAKRVDLDLVVTNPSTIIGELDYRVTPSNAPIQQAIDRGLPFAFDSGLTIVHAEDVAIGHLLALRKGRSWERYILGGTTVTIPEYFNLICEMAERPKPLMVLPKSALLSAGLGFSCLRYFNMRVPFTFRQAQSLAGKYGWYSSEKAVIELDYSWRPLRESIASYIRWRKELVGRSRKVGVGVNQ